MLFFMLCFKKAKLNASTCDLENNATCIDKIMYYFY